MIKATLHIDDKIFKVLYFYYDFHQPKDVNGRPTGKPVFRGIRIMLESQQDLNLEEWAMAANQKKQLELHLSPTTIGGKTRIIYLIDAHLVKWDVNFNNTSTSPMTETLFITCGGLKEGIAEYTAYWRTTYPSNVAPTKVYQEEEEIIDCYLTDLENNENPNLEVEKEVYLVIKTENLIGQTKDIDISNFGKTFTYKEKVLENNTLNNFSISKDLHKIKLKIITPQEKPTTLKK